MSHLTSAELVVYSTVENAKLVKAIYRFYILFHFDNFSQLFRLLFGFIISQINHKKLELNFSKQNIWVVVNSIKIYILRKITVACICKHSTIATKCDVLKSQSCQSVSYKLEVKFTIWFASVLEIQHVHKHKKVITILNMFTVTKILFTFIEGR